MRNASHNSYFYSIFTTEISVFLHLVSFLVAEGSFCIHGIPVVFSKVIRTALRESIDGDWAHWILFF